MAKETEGIKAHDPTKGTAQLSPTSGGHGHGRYKPGRGKAMLKNVPLRISLGFPSLADLC